MKNAKRRKILGFCAILLCLSVGFTATKAEANEGTELPAPISFKCDTQLVKNSVPIDTIEFELSESNPTWC